MEPKEQEKAHECNKVNRATHLQHVSEQVSPRRFQRNCATRSSTSDALKGLLIKSMVSDAQADSEAPKGQDETRQSPPPHDESDAQEGQQTEHWQNEQQGGIFRQDSGGKHRPDCEGNPGALAHADVD